MRARVIFILILQFFVISTISWEILIVRVWNCEPFPLQKKFLAILLIAQHKKQSTTEETHNYAFNSCDVSHRFRCPHAVLVPVQISIACNTQQ